MSGIHHLRRLLGRGGSGTSRGLELLATKTGHASTSSRHFSVHSTGFAVGVTLAIE